MSDGLFHCVCRTCPAEQIADDVAGRASFFEAHAEHEVVTATLPTRTAEPESRGRVVELRASD
ncbi:hypothetical protein [Haloglomus halophilum]|jgi:hypothetical protein|uniref:hypothetical protein n=1 Tax=Haloglomus halophilum TaxID=2962672 RepID=UPI0020C9D7B2|nr:hypothetical protein [Haloglomus halophilum]